MLYIVAIIALLPAMLIMATINSNDIAEASIYKNRPHNFNCGINRHASPCCEPPTTDKVCINNSLGQNQTNSTKSNLP